MTQQAFAIQRQLNDRRSVIDGDHQAILQQATHSDPVRVTH